MSTHIIDRPAYRSGGWLARGFAALAAMLKRERAINDLETLTDARLKDIGVERRDIARRIDREMARLNARRTGRIDLG